MKTGKREVLKNKSQGREAIRKLNITQEADQDNIYRYMYNSMYI